MDYQASTSVCKVVSLVLQKKLLAILGVLVLSVLPVLAQATNPLTEEVSVTAVVLAPPIPPQTYPNTPPVTGGPINMANATDVAIFRGVAYPGSVVSVLKNGTIVAEVPANPNGSFEIKLYNLSSGSYSFGIRAEDKDKLISKLLIFTIYVSSGIATVVDGIFIPPSITSDKVEVKKGNTITFSGYSSPDTEVRLSFNTDVELFKKTKSNATGIWVYKLDSSEFDLGDYTVKVRSITLDDLSPYSDTLPFKVTTIDKLRQKAAELAGFRKRCDLNYDNRVNLLDFSIMAFWYKRLGFPPRIDLSGDAKINLTDLSILAYCWTG